MQVSEIPLSPQQQSFNITLPGGTFNLRFLFDDTPDFPFWTMDIADGITGVPIVSGIPLVTGHNLLEQYDYLAIGGAMYVATDNDVDVVPTFKNLGITSRLYFVVP